MLSEQLQQQANDKLSVLYQTAAHSPQLASFRRQLSPPELQFTQRGKIAGSARLQSNVINLNSQLFSENAEYFLNQVIAHELAHILVHQCYGRRVKPHGEEWRCIMQSVFSLPAKVTHALDVSSVALKHFTYACDCGEVELSIIRHNKVQSGKQQYICRKCHTNLTLSENID